MEVHIQQVKEPKKEQVIIECYKVTETIEDIKRFIQSRDANIEVYEQQTILHIPLSDIYYVEAVDNHVFAYLSEKVYEIKRKLYEFEEDYANDSFFRCSKQYIVNLMKIVDISPALNGRFVAKLANGETVIISRKYVKDLLSKLRGEERCD